LEGTAARERLVGPGEVERRLGRAGGGVEGEAGPGSAGVFPVAGSRLALHTAKGLAEQAFVGGSADHCLGFFQLSPTAPLPSPLQVLRLRAVVSFLAVVETRHQPIIALRELRHLPLHGGIPVVLDRVVSAARQFFTDLCPPVSQQAVFLSRRYKEEDPLLFFGPLLDVDMRVEVVVPALATLLADPPGQMLGYEGPLVGAVFLHQTNHCAVFLLCPGACFHGSAFAVSRLAGLI